MLVMTCLWTLLEKHIDTWLLWYGVSSHTGTNHADMPPGTDCPYPIRILAFFEMIRPYHVVIRI